MLRRSKALFKTYKQEFKNLLLDVVLDESSSIEDFFRAVGGFDTPRLSKKDKHKVIRSIILDADLWKILESKINERIKVFTNAETDALVVMGSPNIAPEVKDLIRPFFHSFFESADTTVNAINSLKKLREVAQDA